MAQPGGDTADAADISNVQRAPKLAAAMHRMLHQESIARWPDGWQMARRLGPPALPALRLALRSESHARKRMLWLGAVAAASRGADAVAWLTEVAGRGRIEESTLALLCLAVMPMSFAADARGAAAAGATAAAGPDEREAAGVQLEQLAADARAGSMTATAAALAATRFSAANKSVEVRAGGRHVEQVGSALRGGLTLEQLARLRDGVREARPSKDVELVLRAAFLGREGRLADELETLAVEIAQQPRASPALRIAGAIYLGRRGVSAAKLPMPDDWVRAALAAFPIARGELYRAGALAAVPEVLTDAAARQPLVAAFACAATWEALAREAPLWSRDATLAETIGLVVVWRALRDDVPPSAVASTLLSTLESTAAGGWLAWTLRQARVTAPRSGGDERLQRVAALAQAQRMDRALVALEVEDALWRAGAHPSVTLHRAWSELVCDALLAGSDRVSARLQLVERPSLPQGIENSNETWFLVADELLRFFTERLPGPPPELRLR